MTRSHSLRAVAFLAALVAVFFFTAVNQAQAGTIATPTGTGAGGPIDGTISGSPRHVGFAGLIKASIDGTETFAYCIDINNPLQMNQPHEEGDWSESNVANLAKITRILQQHPADGTAARNDTVEAAAVQAAIWHFSDGFNLTSGAAGVVATYNQIVADADANPAAEPQASLELTPAQRTGSAGDYLNFELATTATGDVSLAVAPTGGAELVTCDAAHTPIGSSITGPYPKQLCLRRTTPGGPISLTASATAKVAAGKVFLRQGSQKLVLAASRTVESNASATGTWTPVAPPPNKAPSVALSCPTGGFVHGESATLTAIGQDADNDVLTYNWQRNGVTLPGTGNSITVILQAADGLTVSVTDSKGASSSPATLSASCGHAPQPVPTVQPAPTVQSAPVVPPAAAPPVTAPPVTEPLVSAPLVSAPPAESTPIVIATPAAAPAAPAATVPAAVAAKPQVKPVAKARPKVKVKVKAKVKPKANIKAKVKTNKLEQQPTAKKAKPRVLPFTP